MVLSRAGPGAARLGPLLGGALLGLGARSSTAPASPAHRLLTFRKAKCVTWYEEMVRLLLANGANIDAKAETFTSPLHCEAARGHLGCAKILIKNGVDCRIVTTGWDGATGTAEEVARRKGFSDFVAVVRVARNTKK